MIKQAQRVLDFWFGPLENKFSIPEDKSDMWFRNGKAYDEIIRAEFLKLHTQASNGELSEWRHYPKSLLALIILLDQFSRHLYRGHKRAYAQDADCLYYVSKGITSSLDRDLYFIERKFFYMPLMHAEDIAAQELSVKMYTRLCDEAPPELKQMYARTLSFAKSHHHVIDKFGRFPELNQILGRTSTAQETAFLKTGKYRFL